jgi:hypothetical protein
MKKIFKFIVLSTLFFTFSNISNAQYDVCSGTINATSLGTTSASCVQIGSGVPGNIRICLSDKSAWTTTMCTGGVTDGGEIYIRNKNGTALAVWTRGTAQGNCFTLTTNDGYACISRSSCWSGDATLTWSTVNGSGTNVCVFGCMDQSATNYNSAANQDDGSCTYPDGGSDNCATATPIDLSYGSACINGDNSTASSSLTTINGCHTDPVNEVWYQYTVTGAVNTFSLDPGTLEDAVIRIYTGGCGSPSVESCNTASGSSTLDLSLGFDIGQQIWIAVASASLTDGDFQLCVASTPPPPGAGNTCAEAIPVCSGGTYVIDQTPQTASGFRPSCFGQNPRKDTYITFTVLETGTFEWTAQPTGASSGVELDWALHNITNGCVGSGSTEVACNWNYAGSGGNHPVGQITGSSTTCPTSAATGNPALESCPPSTLTPGVYALQIDYYNGIAGDLTFEILDATTAVITPQVDFTIDPAAGIYCTNSLTVNITDNSYGSPTYTFGNGTTYTGNNPPSQTYTESGAYAITAYIDDPDCPSFQTQYIQLYTPVTAVTSYQPESCPGTNDACVSVVPTGGSGTYTYAWSMGGRGVPTRCNLAPGSYTVTVTDATCGTSTVETIVVPAAAACCDMTVEAGAGGTLCANETVQLNGSYTNNVGTVTVSWSPTGGLSNPNILNPTFTPTSAGPYSFTLSIQDDVCLVQDVVSYTVNPVPLVDPITNQTLCAGSTTTAVNFTGTVGATYSWSNSNTAIGLTASGTGNIASFTTTNAGSTAISGTISVTPTLNGCVGTPQTFTITVNPIPVVNAVTSQTVCAGQSFTAVNFTGTAGSTYSWENTNTTIGLAASGSGNIGAFTGTNTGTTAIQGTVSVTPTLNGCVGTPTSYTYTVNPIPTITVTPTNPLCAGGTGSATATSNLTGTYTWSAGTPSGSSVSNLTAPGSYAVTITTSAGCVNSTTFNITAPTAVSVTTVPTPVLCNGGNNGSIQVTGSGGTAGYNVSWSGPSNGNPAGTEIAASGGSYTISSLTAGSYTVSVTDANGCVQTSSATITQPAALVLDVDGTNVSCNGGNNGTAFVNSLTGGTTGYTYSWSPSGGAGTTASNLTAGTYTLLVTDANGCTVSDAYVVTQPAGMTLDVTGTNVSCNGGNNGSANAAVGGGTPGYTYNWSPSGGTGANATNLTAGTYTVVVTDAAGCTISDSYIVTQPPAVSVTAVSTSVTCNGLTNGTATATGSGGTGAISYAWDAAASFQTGATASNLGVGSYTVTATDANGCIATTTVAVTGPTAVSVTASGTDPLCNGAATGSVTSAASGGTGGYTYNWSTLGAGQNHNGTVAAGSYTVTATDANGCTATANVTLINPPAITLTASGTNPTCAGFSNGSVTSSATGGTGTISYNWSTLGAGQNHNGTVAAGSYTVTATDDNGCIATANVNLVDPPAVTVSATGTNVSCNGGNNGTASATAGGGTAPLSYNWSPSGGTGANATNLTAGTYTVVVTDFAGCTISDSYIVTQPPAVSVTTVSTSVTCNGLTNGTATATGSGGTGAISYAWDAAASFQTGATASNLGVGSYTVTATDANGCIATTTVAVTGPTAVSVTASGTDPLCNGAATGSVTSAASGGTGGYTYNWSTLGAGQNHNGTVAAGSYTVTATDANGCTATANVTLINPPAITLTASGTNPTCAGFSNGSVTSSATGGTGTISYNWSTLGAGQNHNGTVAAGSYTVTATDDNGCIATANVNLVDPPAVTVSATGTNVSCNGGNNGTAAATAGGGTPGYTYNWSPSGGTNASASNLTAGTYTVVVTDAAGCTVSDSYIVTQPPAVSVTTSGNPALCNGSADGDATAVGAGGTAPYTYQWGAATGNQATATATGLAAGTYNVVVTDFNGCTAPGSYVVTEPSAISLTTNSVDANCGSPTGEASVSAAGGAGGYTYNWSNSGTGTDITGLNAGSYAVTVTDANGCTQTASAAVSDAGAPTLTIINPVHVLCFGGNNGSAEAEVSGGTPGYTYIWSNGQTTSVATNLNATTHSVTITDSAVPACVATASIVITQPSQLIAGILSSTNVSCNGGNNGEATVEAAGGTTNYTYLWPSGGSNANETNLSAGSHIVTVTDANGCINTATAVIIEPSAITLTAVPTDALCNGTATGSVDLTASGGTAPYSYNWSNSASSIDITNVAASTYTVTVTDFNGCTSVTSAVVNEPTAISVTASSSPSNCGQADGAVEVVANGGTGTLDVLWTGSHTTNTVNNLVAGTYNVTITDDNGCSETASATISDLGGGTLTLVIDNNVSCNGVCDGAATASITGGTAPYTYTWSNGNAGVDLTSQNTLCAGAFSVTVEDAVGCISNIADAITQPTALVANVAATTHVLCNGDATGAININVAGGTTAYSFNWSNGDNTEDITGLLADTYTVTVTDANNCTVTTSSIVNEPIALVLTAVPTDALCNGAATGSVDLTVTEGTAPYSYNWSNSASSQDITNVAAGTYTVTVTDFNGCTSVTSAVVNEPTAITVTASSSPSNCGQADGSVEVVATGGTGTLAVLWTGSHTTNTVNNLVAGTYNVTITDDNGCTETASATISDLGGGTLTLVIDNNVSCNGVCDGAATAAIVGGTTPYTYTWSNGNAGVDLTSQNTLCAGAFAVTVEDAVGCISNASDVITQPTALIANVAATTHVLCNGDATGAININVAGGTTGYSFNWSNGDNNEDITGLLAGNYTVTVTDANNCTVTTSSIVNEPLALVLTAVPTDALCNGAATGSVDLTVTEGTAPYSYNWSNSASSTDISNVAAGTYTVTVTDFNGCTSVTSAVVGEPTAVVATMVSCENESNPGLMDGSSSVSGSGGTPGYTFLWNTGSTADNISSLPEGTYNVTVTDANGCVATNQCIISSVPCAVTATAVVDSDISCFGANDGSATATLSGSTGDASNFSYAWCNGENTQTAVSLAPGSCFVTITDQFGCNDIAEVTILEPSALVTSITGVDLLCNGDANGTIDVTVSGATAPYAYSWSDGPTAQDRSGLSGGSFSVTISDGNGCFAVESIVLTEPTPLVASISGTDVSCNAANDGSVDFSISGGTTPYSFNWSNGSSSEDLAAVGGNTYSVTMTDGNGCIIVRSHIVNEPAALSITTSATTSNCGQPDGSVSAVYSGGTAPLAILWETGDNTATVNGLPADTYDVTVTDNNGCTISSSASINDAGGGVASISAFNNVSCFEGSDGSATVDMTGGSAPFSYAWSNGQTNASANNLTVGTYTVVVTDDVGCISNTAVTITQPTALTTSVTRIDPSCNTSCDGQATVNVGGGSPAYSYSWSNGQSNTTTTGLCGDVVYYISVTDNLGCFKLDSIRLLLPPALVVNVSTTPSSCGQPDGSATVSSVDNSANPLSFLWDNGSTDQTNSNIPAGTYFVTVTDNLGCQAIGSGTFNDLDGPSATASNLTNVLCFGSNEGSVTVVASGGASPLSYNWSSTPAQNTTTATGLVAGTYFVTVTDANGCIVNASADVTQPTQIDASIPTSVSVTSSGAGDGSATASGSGGTAPYTYLWDNGASTATINGLDGGTYCVTVTDVNGCADVACVVIDEPGAIIIVPAAFDATCFGASDGSLTTTSTGGITPHTYEWFTSPGNVSVSTNQNPTGLPAGSYYVVVTDQNSISRTSNVVTINQPTAVTANISSFGDVDCFSNCNGFAEVTAGGGTPGYAFTWSNGANNATATGLCAGTFSVTVLDNNNCPATTSVTITQPAALNLSLTPNNLSCANSADGSVTSTVSGGTAPYSYNWNTTAVNPDITGLAIGSYSLTVTDDLGCTIAASTTLTQPVELLLSSSATQSTCGQSDATATVVVNQGVAPYSYLWSANAGNQTTAMASNIPAGSYVVTVTDGNGCTKSQLQSVSDAGSPSVTVLTQTNVSCFGGSDGFAQVEVIGGTLPYTYSWTDPNGQTTASATGLPAGVWTAAMVDITGCQASVAVSITQPTAVSVSIASANDVTCNGGNDGSATATAFGGTGAFSYQWNDGAAQTSPTASNLVFGAYIVVVEDANGCAETVAVTISEPPAISLAANVTDAFCNTPSGSIAITPTNGTAPFNYNWSDGSAGNPGANFIPKYLQRYSYRYQWMCWFFR